VAATKVSRLLDAAAVMTSTPNMTEGAATDSHCPWSQELESAMYSNAFKCHLVVVWTPTLPPRNQDQNESAADGGAKLSKMFVNANRRCVRVPVRRPRSSRVVPTNCPRVVGGSARDGFIEGPSEEKHTGYLSQQPAKQRYPAQSENAAHDEGGKTEEIAGRVFEPDHPTKCRISHPKTGAPAVGQGVPFAMTRSFDGIDRSRCR